MDRRKAFLSPISPGSRMKHVLMAVLALVCAVAFSAHFETGAAQFGVEAGGEM
jgi:hypothetical protein